MLSGYHQPERTTDEDYESLPRKFTKIKSMLYFVNDDLITAVRGFKVLPLIETANFQLFGIFLTFLLMKWLSNILDTMLWSNLFEERR